MFACFVLSAAFFRPKTSSDQRICVKWAFGVPAYTRPIPATTGTIVLVFISLFFAVAQERNQFIDRLALQPARIQIPAYVCAFL